MVNKVRVRMAIFASGNGSNAENIISHFKNNPCASVSCVCCNKAGAYVLERAKKHQIPSLVFSKQQYHNGEVLNYLASQRVQWVVLAGFLWLVPQPFLDVYPNKIVNIHPSLLPAYGGKGMYGKYVHEAVWKNKEAKTGITIHYVNPQYDEGQVIFQASSALSDNETPDTIAKKVHELEHLHFPKVIESLICK